MSLLTATESTPSHSAGVPAPRAGAQPATTTQIAQTLATAKAEQTFTVTGFCEGASPQVAQRLHDLGFRVGVTVTCLRRAPLGSPLMFRVCDTDVCLRKQQAALIAVG